MDNQLSIIGILTMLTCAWAFGLILFLRTVNKLSSWEHEEFNVFVALFAYFFLTGLGLYLFGG